jgi:hypothetical protein
MTRSQHEIIKDIAAKRYRRSLQDLVVELRLAIKRDGGILRADGGLYVPNKPSTVYCEGTKE